MLPEPRLAAPSGRLAAVLCGLLLVAGDPRATPKDPASAPAQGHDGHGAFSHVTPGLSSHRRLDLEVGRALFERLWVTAPSSTQASDGLGPLYNARSCAQCHPGNGRGLPPASDDGSAGPLVLHVGIPAADQGSDPVAGGRLPDPVYGAQLQDLSIAGVAAEARVAIDYDEESLTPTGGNPVVLRHPHYRVDDLAYGPLDPGARVSPRIASPVIGLGLIEAVDEREILRHADPDDRDGDGISGRPNRVWSREAATQVLGRFGHKAGKASLSEQVQAAFFQDIGISTPLYPLGAGDCTARQTDCRAAADGNSPQYQGREAGAQVTGLLVDYIRHLAVPPRRESADPDLAAGEALFEAIGCGGCHVPVLRTAATAGVVQHRDREIRPYSDLLLHDMGPRLADALPEGQASGAEWRTAPLWGIGLTAAVSGGERYLHDGRARSLIEAILWHGGEAQAQRDRVLAISERERGQLIRFMRSL